MRLFASCGPGRGTAHKVSLDSPEGLNGRAIVVINFKERYHHLTHYPLAGIIVPMSENTRLIVKAIMMYVESMTIWIAF